MEPNIEDTRTELNCSLSRGVLFYAEHKYGRNVADALVNKVGISREYLMDGGNWISFDCYNRVLDALVETTGNPDAPYEAGLVAANPEIFGGLRVFARHLLTVGGTYRLAMHFMPRYAKICKGALLECRPGRAVLRVTYPEGIRQTRNNCENLRGHFAMAPQWMGRPAAEVKQIKCAAQGDDACVYEATWEERPTYPWMVFGVGTGLLISLCFWGGSTAEGAYLWMCRFSLPIAGGCIGYAVHLRTCLKEIGAQQQEESEALIKALTKIEEGNADLQKRIENRTAELSKANRELEQALADLKESQEKRL